MPRRPRGGRGGTGAALAALALLALLLALLAAPVSAQPRRPPLDFGYDVKISGVRVTHQNGTVQELPPVANEQIFRGGPTVAKTELVLSDGSSVPVLGGGGIGGGGGPRLGGGGYGVGGGYGGRMGGGQGPIGGGGGGGGVWFGPADVASIAGVTASGARMPLPMPWAAPPGQHALPAPPTNEPLVRVEVMLKDGTLLARDLMPPQVPRGGAAPAGSSTNGDGPLRRPRLGIGGAADVEQPPAPRFSLPPPQPQKQQTGGGGRRLGLGGRRRFGGEGG